MIELISSNTTSTGGYSVGNAITLDASSTTAAPYAATYYPDSVQPPASTTSQFADWAGDIFDNFGNFCIYDTTSQTYFYPDFALNSTTATINFTFQGDSYTIVYGNRVQGYYTFNISKTSGTRPYRFVCWGNLGSDTWTTHVNESTTINVNWGSRTYYYYRNYQSTDNNETIQFGVVPYDGSINAIAYVANFNAGGADNLVFYTNSVTTGLNFYMKKGPDTNYDWVGYDLRYDLKLTFNESIDRLYAGIGDIINYKFVIKNNGNTGSSTVFMNTIPSGTSLVANSVVINNITIPAASPASLTVGTLPIGTTTISFNLKVNSIPAINPLANAARLDYTATVIPAVVNGVHPYVNSNLVNTQINAAVLSANKIATTYAIIGDVLTYTIPLINTGNVVANNVIFKDTIPNNTIFTNNSFSINGVIQTGASPTFGINIGTVPIGTTTLVFKVNVYSLPTSNIVYNSANVVYNYTADPSIPNGSYNSINTNIATTQIVTGIVEGVKTVDKYYTTANDIVMYTIVLRNKGTAAATNFVIHDTLPSGVTFVTNSMNLNGVSISGIPSSIYVGTIAASAVSTITFKVKVT